jgi:sugar transferase (PEP-CTERM/EpsH1 system associated)
VDNLLLLAHRLPYPPNKGDKIRSFHLLRFLSTRYRVYLGTFVDHRDDWQHVPTVQALCAASHFAPLHPLAARMRSLAALAGSRPLSCDYYANAALRAWVDITVREQRIERILCFSSPMAQYAARHSGACRVMDFVDVDSEKWRAYSARRRWPLAALYRREARRLLQYERSVAAASDATLFVSAAEAALFRTLAPESAARTGYYSNGVDTGYFSPHHALPSPFTGAVPVLVFTGAMDYWPNIDAVTWFATEVLPLVHATAPAVRFCIVGANPAPAVRRLAALPGVTVTGTVPDVRPYLAHAALCVAPMRVARGIQNKVLEAMAMARTVLVSPAALEGIDAEPGGEVLVGDDAPGYAAQVLRALARPAPALGQAARRKVEARYGWDANLAPLLPLIEHGVARQPAERA